MGGGVDALGHARHDGDAASGQRAGDPPGGPQPLLARLAGADDGDGPVVGRLDRCPGRRGTAGGRGPCAGWRGTGRRGPRPRWASSPGSAALPVLTRASSSPPAPPPSAANSARSRPASTASRNAASRKDAGPLSDGHTCFGQSQHDGRLGNASRGDSSACSSSHRTGYDQADRHRTHSTTTNVSSTHSAPFQPYAACTPDKIVRLTTPSRRSPAPTDGPRPRRARVRPRRDSSRSSYHGRSRSCAGGRWP